MNLADMPLAAFDIESTGPDPTVDRIVTASIVKIVGSETSTHEWLLDPGTLTDLAKHYGVEQAGARTNRPATASRWPASRGACCATSSRCRVSNRPSSL